MRKISLTLSIIGIATLLLFLFQDPKETKTIDSSKVGELVKISGQVSNERELSFGKTFNIREIKVFCECKRNYEQEYVEIIGVVEDYYELRVNVLKIKAINLQQ